MHENQEKKHHEDKTNLQKVKLFFFESALIIFDIFSLKIYIVMVVVRFQVDNGI